ncbi:USP domain-containing protein [Aphelenchoides bicaudatus]|nr:USP domain-containing protein [Aphelenchoides bicaudatus]
MKFSSDFILNHNAPAHQQNAVNGVDRHLEFVSAGYCQIDDAPEGCIVFGASKLPPKPQLKLRTDEPSSVSRPQTSFVRVDTPRPTQKRPLINGTDSTPAKRPFSVEEKQEKRNLSPKRPLSNGTSVLPAKFLSSPTAPAKKEQEEKQPVAREHEKDSKEDRNGFNKSTADDRLKTQHPVNKEEMRLKERSEKPTKNGDDRNGNDRNGYSKNGDDRNGYSKNGDDRRSTIEQNDKPQTSKNGISQSASNDFRDQERFQFNWQGLDIVRANRGCGLHNTRNDCFMNSVLQFVFHTPQLVRFILGKKNRHSCADDTRCIYCTLIRYCNNICLKQSFTAIRLREIVNSQFPNRIANNQEDAHEMLIFLLSKLEPPLPKKNGSMPIEPRPKVPTTEIDRIFGGKLKYKIQCHECTHSQGRSEQFRELNLNLGQSPNQYQITKLEHYIESYFKIERLNDYKCDKCGKKNSIRQPCIEVPPNILVIQLKRFRYNGSKNHVEIAFPTDLNLTKFAFDKDHGLNYRLYGFISHSGMSANSGHYKATMLGYDKKWYQFDDDYVSMTNPDNFDQRQPYLLFYHKTPAVSRQSQNQGMFSMSKQSTSKSPHQWNLTGGVKRPLVDKNNIQNGSSQRNGYSNGSSSYQTAFKKPTNGYSSHSNGDRWSSQNGSNGHHSNMNSNGKPRTAFDCEKFYPSQHN